MNDEAIRQMIDGNYDDTREDGLRSMLGEFYNRRMATTVVLVWTIGLALMGAAIYSAVAFFGVAATKYQIMYATIFLMCLGFLGLLKIFAWQTIHRNSIKREIKRLELRIAELTAASRKAAS